MLSQPISRIVGIEEELRGRQLADVSGLHAWLNLLFESEDAITISDLKTIRLVAVTCPSGMLSLTLALAER